MEKICVAVRLRPPVAAYEDADASGTSWRVENSRISLHRPLGTPISGAAYAFDHVFDQDSDNASVYELLTKDIIRAAVDGFNGTAFAYGQTSSGKTHTMNGTENDPGVIQLAVKDVFTNTKKREDREFLIRVSYMEIYNEEINDLFAPGNHKLQIHESLERGIFVAGLREEIVNNADQVFKLLELGEVNRHFGKTNMNARSSRSHTIFRMVIESKRTNACSSENFSSDVVRVSVLNMVDLAGSERIAKTGAGGVRLKEGKYINKSLMILGNVINKLSDAGKQRAHIPYRDSKLTRILQPALGGNAKTSIICTIAPEEVHIEETRGTLQFASRAKRITNCVQVNEILTDAALLKRQKLEIEELRRKLQGSHSEVLEQEILKLRNDMLKYELERERLAMELEEERRSKRERDNQIKESEMKTNNLNSIATGFENGQNSSKGEASLGMSETDNGLFQEDIFETPNFKSIPNAFVISRSSYSRMPEFSPVPDNFTDFADEDMWLRMNKGQTTDLDAIQVNSAYKNELPPFLDSDVSFEKYEHEIEKLRSQLQDALQRKEELEKNNAEQMFINNQLATAISELHEELLSVREIPQRMCESVITCKDLYKDVISIITSFAADENSSNAKLLTSTNEIGTHLFSTLETHLLRIMDAKIDTSDGSLVQECQELSSKLNSAISTLVCLHAHDSLDKDFQTSFKDLYLRNEAKVRLREALNLQLEAMKDKFECLEREDQRKLEVLEAAEEKCLRLERECNLLKKEKDFLAQKVYASDQQVVSLTSQKEEILKNLCIEQQKRKEMEEMIENTYLALANRHGLLLSYHNKLNNKIEKLRETNRFEIQWFNDNDYSHE